MLTIKNFISITLFIPAGLDNYWLKEVAITIHITIICKLFYILKQVYHLFFLPTITTLERWYHKMMLPIQQISYGHRSKVFIVYYISHHNFVFI